jgi:hypothetical protein
MGNLESKPNARFWFMYRGDWVKITIPPGKELAFGAGWYTDEGSKREYQSFCYDPNEMCIWSIYETQERDCDGHHEYHSQARCSLADLKANPADEEWGSPATPAWEKVSAHERDYFAEAMDY